VSVADGELVAANAEAGGRVPSDLRNALCRIIADMFYGFANIRVHMFDIR
jgi:hypothetical protein